VIEFVLELLLETVGQGLIELLVEGIARLTGASFGRRDRVHPAVSATGLLLLGAGIGGASAWLWPVRMLPVGPFPGLSVLISPSLNGIAAEWIGRWQERHGKPRSAMATFWGGGLFALGLAATRYLMLS
jgi:hypothetical protein